MGHKVVILEDDEILQQALTIELSSAGYEVLGALDGESGMDIIRAEKPDLILLDIMMPKLDGYGVLDELEKDQELARIPVIVLTNLGQDEDKDKALEKGADDFFVKSDTELEKLSQKVSEYIGKSAA